MIEIIMICASVVAMAKIAEFEDFSWVLWGGLTLLLCIGCAFLIPLPLIRIAIGFAASYAAMFAYNLLYRP
jgi:hypothetical protein